MKEMKDSGVVWIDKVPSNWELTKAKNIFNQRNERGNANEVLLSATQMYGMIPQEQLEGVVQTKEETDLQTFKTVHINDYVISLRSFQGGFEASDYEGVCSPAYQVFYNTKKINHKYFRYLFKSDGFIEKMNSLTVGIREGKNIQYKDFAQSIIPYPPYVEQLKIADYLDLKCAQIDSIISKQEAIIEKLKEYKLSVITEAVTKGLNPNVEMKESGVEWIGEIPKEWICCRIKNIYANVKNPIKVGPFGSQLTTVDYVEEGKWVYTQRVVLDNNFKTNDTFISEEKYEQMKGFSVEEGDILITTRGTGTTGHIAKVPYEYCEGILHPCLMRIKIDENKCMYRFLYHVFENSAYIRKQIDFANNTSSLPVLYSYTLNNLYIALPSIEKQTELVNYMDNVCNIVDKKISISEALIEKMKEYKKSLIYEMVTGKKEV